MLSNKKDDAAHGESEEIAIIQQTDVDAKIAKRSAAALGYLKDPFIESFVPFLDRKSPIINRGKSLTMCPGLQAKELTYGLAPSTVLSTLSYRLILIQRHKLYLLAPEQIHDFSICKYYRPPSSP